MDVTPKADWYPDPSGQFDHRYWDGTHWTEHVSTNGKQSTDVPPDFERLASGQSSSPNALRDWWERLGPIARRIIKVAGIIEVLCFLVVANTAGASAAAAFFMICLVVAILFCLFIGVPVAFGAKAAGKALSAADSALTNYWNSPRAQEQRSRLVEKVQRFGAESSVSNQKKEDSALTNYWNSPRAQEQRSRPVAKVQRFGAESSVSNQKKENIENALKIAKCDIYNGRVSPIGMLEPSRMTFSIDQSLDDQIFEVLKASRQARLTLGWSREKFEELPSPMLIIVAGSCETSSVFRLHWDIWSSNGDATGLFTEFAGVLEGGEASFFNAARICLDSDLKEGRHIGYKFGSGLAPGKAVKPVLNAITDHVITKNMGIEYVTQVETESGGCFLNTNEFMGGFFGE